MDKEQTQKFESKEGQEKAEIILHLFRHGEKENDKTKSDTTIELTDAGKLYAQSLSIADTDMSQSMAFGSPRNRALGTAGLVMAGSQDGITGTENSEELKQKLDEGREYGTKLLIDPRLNFELPPAGPYFDGLMAAFKGGTYLKYVVEQSDARAKELGFENHSTTYSNQVSRIAEIVRKYIKTLPRWESLVKDETKDYKPKMERFFGTHQSISESFLAKVIELTKGVAERDVFVSAIGNQGFGFAEGYDVEITTGDDGEEKVHIIYKKEKDGQVVYEFDEVVSPELVESLIQK